MAQPDLAKFVKEYLPKHPQLKERIDAVTNQDRFVAAILDAGTQAGFQFSSDEVREALAARRSELSEDKLEAVSGGSGRKTGEGQQDYLKITMTDVLISSYHTGGSG